MGAPRSGSWLLVERLEALGHPDPEKGAEQLELLVEGTLVMGATNSGEHPARVARQIAATILR